MVEPYTGPYPDMKSFYKDMLQAQLEEADRSRVAKGRRENGLRDRLDAFAERGLENVLSKKLAKDVEPSLIVGDVGMFFLFVATISGGFRRWKLEAVTRQSAVQSSPHHCLFVTGFAD